MQLLASRPYAASVTVHGYDGSFTYPWGMFVDSYTTRDDARYSALFDDAARIAGYRCVRSERRRAFRCRRRCLRP